MALGQHPVLLVAQDELELWEILEQPPPIAIEDLTVLVVLRPHRLRDRLGVLPDLGTLCLVIKSTVTDMTACSNASIEDGGRLGATSGLKGLRGSIPEVAIR